MPHPGTGVHGWDLGLPCGLTVPGGAWQEPALPAGLPGPPVAAGRLPDEAAPPDAHLHHQPAQGVSGRAAAPPGRGRHPPQGAAPLLPRQPLAARTTARLGLQLGVRGSAEAAGHSRAHSEPAGPGASDTTSSNIQPGYYLMDLQGQRPRALPMPPRPEPEGETHGPGWVRVGAREQRSRKRGRKGMGKRSGKEAKG